MINLQSVAFYYKQFQPLFTALDLELEPGHICGLLGKNGAGKTTLLKLIQGLRFVQEGKCQVMGYTPAQRDPGFLSQVYMLSEDLFVPDMRGDQYCRLYAPFYPQFDTHAFHRYLNLVDIPVRSQLSQLSHGQTKKFFIAFALATNCRLLLLDEPTNGLDIPSKQQFRKLLIESMADDRLIIISTHQVKDVEKMIDQVVILDNGQVIFNQTIDNISQTLSFQSNQLDQAKSIYSVPTTYGHASISRNETGEASYVDLELLFNAIIEQPTLIQQSFGGSRHANQSTN